MYIPHEDSASSNSSPLWRLRHKYCPTRLIRSVRHPSSIVFSQLCIAHTDPGSRRVQNTCVLARLNKKLIVSENGFPISCAAVSSFPLVDGGDRTSNSFFQERERVNVFPKQHERASFRKSTLRELYLLLPYLKFLCFCFDHFHSLQNKCWNI